MGHVTAAGLDELDDVVRELRGVDGLKESRAASSIEVRAFLHFHEDRAAYADVRLDADFERMRVTTKAERKRLLSVVRATDAPLGQLSGIASHHWHHQSWPTRMRSLGCQQYEISAVFSK